MNSSIQLIPYLNLALAFIPALVVVIIFIKWSLDFRESLHAISRMLAQLLLVGYFLVFIYSKGDVLN